MLGPLFGPAGWHGLAHYLMGGTTAAHQQGKGNNTLGLSTPVALHLTLIHSSPPSGVALALTLSSLTSLACHRQSPPCLAPCRHRLYPCWQPFHSRIFPTLLANPVLSRLLTSPLTSHLPLGLSSPPTAPRRSNFIIRWGPVAALCSSPTSASAFQV